MVQQQQAALNEQVTRFQSENDSLARQPQAGRSASLSSERLRELLRLWAEVGALRRRQLELEQTIAAAQSNGPAARGTSTPAPPPAGVPVPFQVQLVVDGSGADSEARTNNAGEMLNLQKTPLMDHTAIRSATVTKNATSGTPEIQVEFSPDGQELFAAVTRENINRRLAIVLNGQVFSAPMIRSEITGGKAQITGNFTEEEATELAAKINDAIGNQ
jgi:hypothetical protein